MIHPINVAYILAELGMDDPTICAALLHDVVEDTRKTNEDILNDFGEEIAELVFGVTKLSKLRYETIEEQQVENYRQMFLAMGKDIRVILIKLADRLHNMRTLKFLSRERQIANAKENHGDQCRKSGEPYMIHPMHVAYILAQLELDDETLCAALLHDVVEDTEITREDIVQEFGEEIAEMVDGVTKLRKNTIFNNRGTTSRKL